MVIPAYLALSALYLGFAPRINKALYRPVLFYPEKFPSDFDNTPQIKGIAAEDIYFSGDMGQRLNGWLWRQPDARATILFSHGNSGNLTIRVNMVSLLLESGCSVFAYDYQGFGRSSGTPSVEAICSDGRAAYDYLSRIEGLSTEQLILYGESLGASVSSYLSTVRASRALILQSGFSSLKRIAVENFPFLSLYPRILFPKPELDSLSIVSAREHPPLLVIHGDLDEVIPVQHSIDVYNSALGEKFLVRLPRTGHADIWTTAPEEFSERLAGFIEYLTAKESQNPPKP